MHVQTKSAITFKQNGFKRRDNAEFDKSKRKFAFGLMPVWGFYEASVQKSCESIRCIGKRESVSGGRGGRLLRIHRTLQKP